MLGKKHASAVALPLSAAKNGQHCASITDLVKAGMNVALGTDGAIQAGNLDLFEVMRGAAMSVRAEKGDPAALPSSAALMMATFCGAQAQGRGLECGMLKEGMDADLVLVDFTAPHLMPCHNVLSHLAYAVSGHDVVLTMVRGKILYAAGEYKTIDLNAVVRELADYAMPKLFSRQEAK